MQLKSVLLGLAVAWDNIQACDDFTQLQVALKTNSNGVGDALLACVMPQLVVPVRYLPPGQANEFCELEDCKKVVRELKNLSSCAWTAQAHADRDGDAVAMAQQVMQDCEH